MRLMGRLKMEDGFRWWEILSQRHQVPHGIYYLENITVTWMPAACCFMEFP